MPKNIVICCDGTSNEFGTINTNVVHLVQSIEWHSDEQQVFYDPGVGTFCASSWPLGPALGKILGSAFGYGIKQNIQDAYKYLMDEYISGDKIFIFGFSRGAYTARCLASIVAEFGVLYPGHENMIPYVIKEYLKKPNIKEIASFAKTFSRQVSIHFLGVWDTVGSVGWFVSFHNLTSTDLSPKVKNVVQALSIDEKRKKFPPMLWERKCSAQNIEQQWFAGVHSDVGGGYEDRGLAKIPFKWMINHAYENGLKLTCDIDDLPDGDPRGTLHKSYKGKWYLLGARVRSIPSKAVIHSSALERINVDPDYNPKNLRDRSDICEGR